ncbi:MAG: hypothetical protein V2A79_03235 [Planctomycetota bacterium]
MRSPDCVRAVQILACCLPAAVVGCGALPSPGLPSYADMGPETACLDAWSLVHFASGYYLADELGGDSVVPTVALLVGYELAEPEFWPGFDENLRNQHCDIVTGTLGWLACAAADE